MKCRCVPYLYHRSTGEYPMWFRQTFQDFKHRGLHREWYRVDDLDLWFQSDMEEGSTLTIHRVGDNCRYCFGKGHGIQEYIME